MRQSRMRRRTAATAADSGRTAVGAREAAGTGKAATVSVRIPKRLKQRPQFRGLPIPYIAYIDAEGKPDFRVTDESKRQSVMKNFWCQLCGEPLGKWIFFVGGTEAAKNNAYFEPACHLDCLMYAMQVCPFIAGKSEHVELEKIQHDHDHELGRYVTPPNSTGLVIKTDDTFAAVRNPYWVIKKAQGWTYIQSGDGTILMQPQDVIKKTPPMHAETMDGADWSRVFDWLRG
jgi:hypothetical protein